LLKGGGGKANGPICTYFFPLPEKKLRDTNVVYLGVPAAGGGKGLRNNCIGNRSPFSKKGAPNLQSLAAGGKREGEISERKKQHDVEEKRERKGENQTQLAKRTGGEKGKRGRGGTTVLPENAERGRKTGNTTSGKENQTP